MTINIEKLSADVNIPSEKLKQFAEAYAAKMLEDKDTEVAELQEHINELREALEVYANRDELGSGLAKNALSKTPAQSLQGFENEVIDRCAKVCDDASQPHQDEIHTDAQWAAKLLAANIRALKVTND